MADEDTSQAPEVMPLGEKLSYSTLIERSAPAEMSTRTFAASNGSVFNAGSEVRIPLNVSANTFVNTDSIRLNFGVTAQRTATSASVADSATLDGGALSVIREITIISSDGSIVDRVSSYSLLANVMNQYTKDPSFSKSTVEFDGFHQVPKNCAGMAFATGAGSGTSEKKYFSTKLPYVGCLNLDRYLPLGYLAGSSLTVSILLESVATAIHVTGGTNQPVTTNYQLSDVSISCDCIHYNASTSNSFQQLVSSIGGVQMASKPHSHFKLGAVNAIDQATQQSVQIPSRERSLNYIVTTIHDNARLQSNTAFSISGRVCRDVIEVSHSLAGLQFPPIPITVGKLRQGDLWTEISKALNITHTCIDSTQIGDENGDGDTDALALYCTMTGDTPSNEGGGTKSAHSGCTFAIVQSFDIDYSNQNLESGADTSGQSANVVLNLRLGSTPNGSSIVTSWLNSTAIYTLTSSGTLLSSS